MLRDTAVLNIYQTEIRTYARQERDRVNGEHQLKQGELLSIEAQTVKARRDFENILQKAERRKELEQMSRQHIQQSVQLSRDIEVCRCLGLVQFGLYVVLTHLYFNDV